MPPTANNRSITGKKLAILYFLSVTCLIAGGFIPNNRWFSNISFGVVILISVVVFVLVIKQWVGRFFGKKNSLVVNEAFAEGYNGPGHSWEPLIIDKDYANLDVEVWAEDVADTLLKISDSHAPGVSDERLDEVEKKLDFTFPPAFRALYRRLNGAEGLPNLYSIWTLEEMIHEYNDQNNKDFIPFADAMIRSWFIGFEKDLGAIVNDVALQKPITDNFMHAIDLIIADAPQIY